MIRLLIVLMLTMIPVHAFAETAEDVMRHSQAAFLYPGKDFKARITMRLISKDGQERVRELTMLRKNYGASGGDRKILHVFLSASRCQGHDLHGL